jgi:hypothetical protein
VDSGGAVAGGAGQQVRVQSDVHKRGLYPLMRALEMEHTPQLSSSA